MTIPSLILTACARYIYEWSEHDPTIEINWMSRDLIKIFVHVKGKREVAKEIRTFPNSFAQYGNEPIPPETLNSF